MGESLRTRMFAVAGALALTVALAGCGTSSGVGLPDMGSAPAVDGGSYESIEELKDAVLRAGLDCPEWDLHNKAIYAKSSADCSDNSGMSLYSSSTQMNKQLEAWKIIGEMVVLERLVGKNWTVDTTDPETLQKDMGGTIFRTSGKK